MIVAGRKAPASKWLRILFFLSSYDCSMVLRLSHSLVRVQSGGYAQALCGKLDDPAAREPWLERAVR